MSDAFDGPIGCLINNMVITHRKTVSQPPTNESFEITKYIRQWDTQIPPPPHKHINLVFFTQFGFLLTQIGKRGKDME